MATIIDGPTAPVSAITIHVIDLARAHILALGVLQRT